ncbi:MAG: 23S rRNA (adenine(2503)-C(2))-methyltransferase RlmN [Desulfobulbaceae bacterium]|nr:23S rRNA (adenine(2503)-C(2))-methyltransferase RlmN [Desulfobulbaceae bacterium]HIJ90120.1 23S rRNA (adenine(2503)-C(2))-methyltransferase RlmN [Deltaproteobacteria bacterium]
MNSHQKTARPGGRDSLLPKGGKPDLRDLTPAQLGEYVVALGLPVKRGRQIFTRLCRPGVCDFSQLGISREVMALLSHHAAMSTLEAETVEKSADGTEKFAFRLADGAVIESVLIPEEGRHTLCISSQAGCAMGCRFCLTGGLGFVRNLRPGEIVGQVLAVMTHMLASGINRATPRELLNNLVFMGMGEPLANYDNLLAALTILMDDHGLGFSERRITVSTCGIVPRMDDLGRDIRVNLAVSLHAADDAVRSSLMPVNRTHGLESLLAACRRYPLGKKKVILFEYIMLKGINDSLADARLLAEKLEGIPSRINLLPYNGSGETEYACPEEAQTLAFQKVLREAGFNTFIRQSRGADISAACGQLAGKS